MLKLVYQRLGGFTMKKWLVSGLVLSSLFICGGKAHASDEEIMVINNLDQRIVEELDLNMTDGEIGVGTFTLDSTTNNRVKSISESHSELKEEIQSTLKMLNNDGIESNEEYNYQVNDYLTQIMATFSNLEEDLKESSPIPKMRAKPSRANYNTAVALYRTGIALVTNMGCWYTANYMAHGIVPYDKVQTSYAPATHTLLDNNEFVGKAVNTSQLQGTISAAYYNQLTSKGKRTGTVSGTYAFENAPYRGDYELYTSLHLVNFNATFTVDFAGRLYCRILISDIYDFAFSKYDNFKVGFANNYAYGMQLNGFIKKYTIAFGRQVRYGW